MPQNSGDDRTEPTLELPSLKLPGLGRRRKTKPEAPKAQPAAPEAPAKARATPAKAPVAPEGQPATPAEAPAAAEEQSRAPQGQPMAPEPAPPPSAESPVAVTQRQPTTRVSGVDDADEADQGQEPAAPARRRATERRLPGPAAAALTGAVVGLAGGAGTYAALAGCEAVRGVSTCGGAPGFFVLLAIVVLMVLLGTALLKMLAVTDPGSTSFLAVGIVAVLSMLFLLDVMDSPWMFVVVPALTAGAYLLAQWVTSRYADESTGRQDWM